MRGSTSKPLQILSKRQRRAPTCSESARKMLTKHANARFPGPMSSRARGSKVLQMPENCRHVRSCFQTVARATKKPDVPVFLMPYIIFFVLIPHPLWSWKQSFACVACAVPWSYHAQSSPFHPSIVFLNPSRKYQRKLHCLIKSAMMWLGLRPLDCMVFRGEGMIETQRKPKGLHGVRQLAKGQLL